MFRPVEAKCIVKVMIWVALVIVTIIEVLIDVMRFFTVFMVRWMSIRMGEILVAVLNVVITVDAIVILIRIAEIVEFKLTLGGMEHGWVVKWVVESLIVMQMMVHDVLVLVEGCTLIVWLCKRHFVPEVLLSWV